MTWAKVDDRFPRHPKSIKAGPKGRDFFICGLCYCNEYLTDGFINSSALPGLAPGNKNPTRTADLLVSIGLWDAVDGGYNVHDYKDYNLTAAQIKARRCSGQERLARWREGHSGEPRNAVTSDVTNAVTNAVSNANPTPTPTPTPTEAKKRNRGNRVVLSDDQFLDSLRTNKAYQGLDIDREMGKLDAWLLTPRGRGKQKTRQRVVNWLNGVDKPMPSGPSADPYAKFPRS